VSGGESLSLTILNPFYPRHIGHSPAYADQCHLPPLENTSLLWNGRFAGLDVGAGEKVRSHGARHPQQQFPGLEH
jgi:hypothetical protein